MSDANFYRDLPSFCRFDEITDDSKFHPIPNDWVVFVADIRGSTKAIEQGRYRDVNTIGAATIAAAQNALRGVEFPFSFGGDGATFVVPADRADDLGRCLLGVQALSSERFDLQLRVGSVDVGTVLGAGRAIEVAKFELVEGKAVAVLRGGGAAYAEDLIKADEALLLRPDRAPPAANLSGLS